MPRAFNARGACTHRRTVVIMCVCGFSLSEAEVRGTSCWALDLEFEADKEVAHELHFQCDLRQVASLLARDLIPPPRGHRLALDSVSLVVETTRA